MPPTVTSALAKPSLPLGSNRQSASCASHPASVASRAPGGPIAEIPDRALDALAAQLGACTVTPSGTEGFAKAEVTAGGVDTAALSSRTMEARAVPGLHVVGEAVDVTGWLGGYNFQWAWSSGWAAGQAA